MQNWIEKLQLERHIEGGYFARSYQAEDKVITVHDRYNSNFSNKETSIRHAGSSIYFLLEKDDFSAWHKLKSDEMWHYYDGDSVITIHSIDEQGDYTQQTLGHPSLDPSAQFQVVVRSGVWFAAELVNKNSFALVGCTVFPGFEYEDFILANREKLIEKYPQHTKIIKRLTHEKITADLSK